ncbi:hypothetical protein GWO43_23745 [candidate division KSB1 bacterium]|nr:hypothetical protein [candidate division KSB1 bacterium]NIR73284.1 hypothetical protein [candidate division KSB1 bacterium]NIS26990.1 hypothetical protein [candidate division KSB1 bacterium]NIT73830.1 hypothetical protein [candidate division KSB1 bacterium]NIU27735.1 hypothetical protein [candidate division KSB1 bacterium]
MKFVYILLGLIIFGGVAYVSWFSGNRIQNALLLKLNNAGSVLGYFLSCMTVTLAVIAWIRRQDIRNWLRRSKFEGVGEPFDVPVEKVVATVIPISRREQPEWILRWLTPNTYP